MNPRQIFYPQVVREFMYTMTIRGDDSRIILNFTLDGVESQRDARHIATAMQIPYESPLGHRFRD